MAEILTLRTSGIFNSRFKFIYRFIVITGLVTTIVGCVMKNVAVQSNLYWLLFAGQFISQISWVFVTAFGGRLANLWCLKNEIALASALAIAGSALGMGLGYVIPSLIVPYSHLNTTDCDNCINVVTNQSSEDTANLQNQILTLVSISTGISILNLFGMLLVYNRDPELAANKAERRRSTALSLKIGQFPTTTRQKIKNYLKSVKKIISNKNCRYLIISQRYLLENYSNYTIWKHLTNFLKLVCWNILCDRDHPANHSSR